MDQMISEKVLKIYYFYNNWQRNFEQQSNGNIEFRQGLPSEEDFKPFPSSEHTIVVIDVFKLPLTKRKREKFLSYLKILKKLLSQKKRGEEV